VVDDLHRVVIHRLGAFDVVVVDPLLPVPRDQPEFKDVVDREGHVLGRKFGPVGPLNSLLKGDGLIPLVAFLGDGGSPIGGRGQDELVPLVGQGVHPDAHREQNVGVPGRVIRSVGLPEVRGGGLFENPDLVHFPAAARRRTACGENDHGEQDYTDEQQTLFSDHALPPFHGIGRKLIISR
jgi:hypothetical protein